MKLHDVEEAMGIRKILAYDTRMKKNPQTKEDTSWVFKNFHGVMRVQSLYTCFTVRFMLTDFEWFNGILLFQPLL